MGPRPNIPNLGSTTGVASTGPELVSAGGDHAFDVFDRFEARRARDGGLDPAAAAVPFGLRMRLRFFHCCSVKKDSRRGAEPQRGRREAPVRACDLDRV